MSRPDPDRAEPRPPRADPRCGVPHVREARLPGNRRGRDRAAAETTKGGVYFHFPTKEAIFRELMRTTADRLVAKVERAVAGETDPIARAEAAIRTVLATFAGHRTMARLLFLDVIGAGRVFQAETNDLHDRFARMIAGYLDQAVADGRHPADRHAGRRASPGSGRSTRSSGAGCWPTIPTGSRTPTRRSARSCCGAWASEARIAGAARPATRRSRSS